ncbi:hypothetical protein ACFV0O_00805 [Kitasatospora sp. NPDC059577]|uniref:effector-associated constant component EACC1 n=1 Tax=unclassified Kitasatospora TaxID=2633591 RepID=UPI0036906C6B
MDARIRVIGGDEVRETAELWDWLRRERALAGLVRAVPTPPADGELGGVTQVLEVALGAGGAGAVVARALAVWLRTRRSDVTAEVTTRHRRVRVTATQVRSEDVVPLLAEVLGEDDDETGPRP